VQCADRRGGLPASSVQALLRELGRNPALLQAFGFAVLPIQRESVSPCRRCVLVGPRRGGLTYSVGSRLQGPPVRNGRATISA
jgi:hypothetical protein